jgi:serine protease AprX
MLRSVSSSLVPLLAFAATGLTQDGRLMLRFGAFDPLVSEPALPPGFAAAPDDLLRVVQFESAPTPADRDALTALGATIHWYAPHDAFVVRAPDAARLGELPRVRWVGAFQPAWKVEPQLLASLLAPRGESTRVIVVMVDPQQDEAALVAAVRRVGGTMWRYAAGNLLIEADLTAAQARALLHEDTVLWMQRAGAPGEDIDNARIQGGANALEQLAGHTGKGVRGHMMEGIYANHPEYAANAYRTAPSAVFNGLQSPHGNSAFGIVFAAGVNAQARGLCPDGQGYFTDYNYLYTTPPMSTGQNSRYGVVREVTDPANPWRVMFQSASWGDPQQSWYDARSAEMDWIIHRFDIPICQSQSNTGTTDSRPQAWAKNIISVGGIVHHNTANPNDDSQSGTSMGPADDGRIMPDLCAYYDSVFPTDGAAGYTPSFNGTSSATPIVAGHVGLILEMFTDGYFGHAAAPTWQHRFDHKPHFTTTKALLINTARQYDPAIVGAGAAWRFRQGWGFPAVNDLHDLRRNILVLDELDVLPHGGSRNFWVHVKPGTPQFRSTMVYADLPAAVPFLAPHRVNDLSLRVFAPGGAIYHGNNGMSGFPTALFTAPGGSPNTLDTVENVFVQNPAYGLWRLEVSAPLVAIDQHVETPAVDADFALVASGIGGGRDVSGPLLDLASTPGALSLALTNLPASYTDGFVMFSFATARPLAMGNFLGLELDSLSFLSLTAPATPGDPLHFPPTAVPTQFPNAPFVFPAWLPQLLQGATIDAVAFCFDATGAMRAASNVDRVTVQ